MCERDILIPTHSTKDVNDALVWGSNSIGIKHYQCEELLGTPKISFKTCNRYTENVNKARNAKYIVNDKF